MIWSPFGTKNNAPADQSGPAADIVTSYSEAGAVFRPDPFEDGWMETPERFGAKSELARFLAQLDEEGFADRDGESLIIPWKDVYRILASKEHSDGFPLFSLPPREDWTLSLESRGSLTDDDFSIVLSRWTAPDGKDQQGNVDVTGAVVSAGRRAALLSQAAWETMRALREFHRGRNTESRGADFNRRAWADIRSKANAAGADLSDFLKKTVVLTPERLDIGLRKGDGTGNRLVEVIPGFAGQPRRWIEMFDRLDGVPARYEIPDGDGLTHVLISPEVATVLREIKRMPGRRVAGERAEAFLRNPFAALGPDAEKVVDAEQFERARDEAGIPFSRFTARVRRDASGYPYEVSLLIEEIIGGQVRGDEVRFEGAGDLAKFLNKLDARIAAGSQCCHWEGCDLEILGDTPDQAELLRSALADLSGQKGFKASEILDLSLYSERVEGFGVEKPYYSPFISKKNEDAGWFPENVDFGLFYTPEDGGETVAVVLTENTLADFREEVRKAAEDGRDSFSFPGCPKPVPVKWAAEILDTLGDAANDVGKGTFDPTQPKTKGKAKERRGLVVKPNVDTLDYEERCGALALPPGSVPRLPSSLKSDISLKDHQKEGVAWLQHLWSMSPAECRGAVLADDMGLGKTIQLLTFIARILEDEPESDPFLIVAPVSLLENWKEEIGKFFTDGALPVLTLYGPSLAGKRLPREAVEEELAGAGITRLLKRDWLGGSKVVLTTYETLRDLEFSLAMRKWSAIICDEAQKIKNPSAMVTRAAKKQNARFRVACTGTPVENTLTDLWCLFDFVQPGLLGALKDFGTRYRKPIEAETEDEKARVAELRKLIEPQLLRRTKAEVAKDLPRKIEVPECRSLRISDRQRAHYADAVGAFQRRGKDGPGSGIESHLGLLQYLRRLCSDPKPPGSIGTDRVPLSEIEEHSPKMAWLLKQLGSIKEKAEKAIIFCEFRDLQRTLQRAIQERFGFSPDVINGDTSAAAENANNRQKRIRAFQEKPGFGVIVLSPLAVGFGVNIQAANHVVHFTRTWNPAKEDQATDRAYRIGQTKDVFVYYPVVVADDFTTFDAKLDVLLTWKRSLSGDMLNGTGDLRASDFGDLGAPGGRSAFGDEVLTPTDIEELDPDTFEAFCAILWSKLGYAKTIRTPKSGDGGIDVVAISGKTGVLIQCKSSSVDARELGWEAVKDVVAGSAAYSAKYPGVRFSLAAVTNRSFNGTARHQARMNHVELLDGTDLTERMTEQPVRRGELAAYLFSGRDAS
jgi:superfamily II DNA or RNA helicase/Holliday junction resolvase